MPACSTYSPDLKKSFDYFQRKKVGSIRDNPKLLKIRQQFENASQETSKKKDLRKDIKWPDSAPSSFSLSLSKSSGTVILDELLKINSKFSSKTEAFLKSQLDNTQNRRHSESEVEDRHSLTLFTCNSSSELAGRKASESNLGITSVAKEVSVQNNRTSGKRSPVGTKSFIPSKSIQKQKNNVIKRDNTSENSSSESGVHTNSSASEEENITAVSKNSAYQMLKENSVRLADSQKDAPPIPKRGLSPAAQNNFSCLTTSRRNLSKVPQPLSKEVSTSQSLIKANSVQKAIQIYEGMSSNDVKKNKMVKNQTSQKVTPRKDIHDNIRRSGIPRRSSRRNSMRKSKCLSDKDLPKTSPVPKTSESKTCRDDSGIIVSDTEDKNQSIYQTLSTVVNISQGQYDPYDRLSRIHDVMNRIHKGQSSTCAACKAIPSSVLQYRTDESSFLQVKCNEAAPHHHPPCICFSCQHSIFSCSLKSEASQPDHVDEDNLYYNVCCLNSPNRESWRQSRRRPVCEQNGRLCIVNCDIEQHSDNCDLSKSSEEFYEKLFEWHSTPGNSKRRHPTKQISGDSCDSDEGWVDVTDSEDEKPLLCDTRHLISSRNNINFCKGSDGRLTAQNIAYDLDQIVSKCEKLDISRSSSTEHLYESIADLDNQNVVSNSEENILRSSNGSSTLSLKSEQNPENEFDSGEWSTESASPIFDESSNKENLEQKSSAISNQYRFAVNSECQETAKKNFMKSVLGKKVVNPKKRRMSTFFVPWLVSNQEYGSSSSRNPKSNNKKQNSHSQTISSKASPCKNKRSQSIPSSSPKLSMSCTKALFSSAEVLDKYKDKSSELDNCSRKCLERSFCLNSEAAQPGSSRGSVASSAYLRADQLQTTTVTQRKASISTETTVDVNIERVCRPSTSGDSEHSYILFQPIKEEEVPLYQFYERNIKERVSFCRSPSSMSPVMWSSTSESGPGNDLVPKTIRPTLSVVEQLSPDAKDMKMLWCELPEVKESGILERISAQELKLQEAAFEFIQSQASYIRSLKVLYENFIKTPEFSDIESSSCVLSKHEHDVLFSDIIRVKEVSESLMCELTARWSDGILIPDICDIIHRHAVMPSFSVYVRYCSNRVYQERTLKELKETRLCFLEVLRKLESNPACQGLSLESFLFLPMQHIARLPLLLDNIFRWIVPESPSYSVCKMALEAVHKIFMECNEGARKMERLEEMFVLNKQLEFKDCKVIPLISASRWLLKKGELVKLEFDKKTFGRSSRCVRVPVFIFLFNDLLVVTKRKNEDSYIVVDYCPREKVQAMPINPKDLQQPVVVPNTCRYLIYLTLFNNHQGSAVDMILNCALLSERTRWIEAIHSVPENKPCEVWEYDCPQVQCVRSYIAQQPDELSLQESDVVTIHRKMNDGWYEGRRLRDGLQGWFPASYTMDIPCSRARASNLRQCYRLLMLSQKQ